MLQVSEFDRIGIHPADAWMAPMAKAVAKWMREHTRDKNAWEPTENLYEVWEAWCRRTGECAPQGLQRFGQVLERTLVKQRKKVGRGYRGLRLNTTGGGG
jgi:phage/plasmid-associated DNA primase